MTEAVSTVVRLEGEIDLANAARTLRLLEVRLDAVDTVDLTDVTYLDSAGIHVLFSVARRARASGRTLCFLVPRTSPIRRVVDIAGLDAVAELGD